MIKNSLLRLFLLILVASPATANECKIWQPAKWETKKTGVKSSDWTWSCNSIGSLSGSVFNRTGYSVGKIVITGSKSKRSVGKDVYQFRNNTSYDYYFLSGNGICGVDDQASMILEYSFRTQRFCKMKFTDSEMVTKRQKEEEIAKSKGIDRSAISSVRSVCQEISKNPSIWQKFRWGS